MSVIILLMMGSFAPSEERRVFILEAGEQEVGLRVTGVSPTQEGGSVRSPCCFELSTILVSVFDN